jgi:hypothetical protein
VPDCVFHVVYFSFELRYYLLCLQQVQNISGTGLVTRSIQERSCRLLATFQDAFLQQFSAVAVSAGLMPSSPMGCSQSAVQEQPVKAHKHSSGFSNGLAVPCGRS